MSEVFGAVPPPSPLCPLFQNFPIFLNMKISGKITFWNLSLKSFEGEKSMFPDCSISNVDSNIVPSECYFSSGNHVQNVTLSYGEYK